MNDNPEIRYLGDVQKLSLNEGDILVLSSDQHLREETAERLRQHLEREIPGHKVLILGEGLKLGVLSKDAA
jgi:hypothetical protein